MNLPVFILIWVVIEILNSSYLLSYLLALTVPGHQMPIVTTLTRLFNETSDALGGSRANPARKREIEDNSKRLGGLFAKLNSGDISKNASDKLLQLCQALDNGDFGTALQIQVNQLQMQIIVFTCVKNSIKST